jgi:uncharacterized protein (UPF0276 family)
VEKFAQLPKLGVGLGFREQFRGEVFLHRTDIDFLEITADHYLDASPQKLNELDLLAAHFTLIPHGLNLSLGSAEGIDEVYLEKLARLIDRIKPAWWSEHVCFTKSGGIDIGHLAPLPFTVEAIEVLCRNISKVKSVINLPLVLENITYMVNFPFAKMSEAKFLRILAEETNSGLLLDVTNLYFVGGHKHGDLHIDSHGNKTQNEIWEVFEEVCRRAEVKGAILERDENFPPFVELLEELAQARNIFKQTENPGLRAVV